MPVGVLVGLGLVRIVVAVSSYIEDRERVRFSVVHGIWVANLLLLFIGLWWALWQLRTLQADQVTISLLMFLLIGPCLMYVPSTLLLPDLPQSEKLDLRSIFERVGRPVFCSVAALFVWMIAAQVYLRGFSPFDPPRMAQGALVAIMLLAAWFPSQRSAAIVGAILFIIVGLSFATVRASLT